MATNAVTPDEVQVESGFQLGMVRDVSRGLIPEGGVYDSADFMLEQQGRAYKRGGWMNHSAALPAPPSAVFSLHIPTRVGAIVAGELYDVTSEINPQADHVGAIGFTPAENPSTYVDRVVLCDPSYVNRPKKAYPSGPTGAWTIADLGGSPPRAAHSAIYAGRIVLARGQTDADMGAIENLQRLWFSQVTDDVHSGVEDTWDTNVMFIDTSYEITGLAAILGKLLVFSPRFTEVVVGGVPPGVEGENMELQPVGGVGCLDARSIAVADNQVIFASEEGCFITNGVGFTNLMEKSDRTDILSFWRNLFAEKEVRSVVGGMLMRDHYMLSSRILTEEGEPGRVNLICYLPTQSWWRTTNTDANMFTSGATEQEFIETYAAMADHPYVAKLSPMLRPSALNVFDGNLVPVEPMLETRMFGSGPGLKAYAFGRLTYDMRAPVLVSTWQALTPYAPDDEIVANGAHWRVTGFNPPTHPGPTGLSGFRPPDWPDTPAIGTTVTDAQLVWSSGDLIPEAIPELEVSLSKGIKDGFYLPVPESPLPATLTADRARFSLFRDSQALHLRFAQAGGSELTELYVVEVEHRSYNLASDGE